MTLHSHPETDLPLQTGAIANHSDESLSICKSVSRQAGTVLRPTAPWTASIHSLLKYLEQEGFPAPRVMGSGFAPDGRETITYVEGEFVHPGPWSDEGLIKVGTMLRRLHDLTSSFDPRPDAQWQPWFLHDLGGPKRIIGHGDIAPWNTVTRAGLPTAFIDWEYAGPVDPLAELARACWLFPQLHDDDVAERVGLSPLAVRARQLRLLVDAYGITRAERQAILDRIIDVVVAETALQAIEINVTPESEGPLWGLAWRARSAAWIMRNRITLASALW